VRTKHTTARNVTTPALLTRRGPIRTDWKALKGPGNFAEFNVKHATALEANTSSRAGARGWQ